MSLGFSWIVISYQDPNNFFQHSYDKFQDAWWMFRACRDSGAAKVKLKLGVRLEFDLWSWNEKT